MIAEPFYAELTNREKLIEFIEKLNFNQRDSNWHCSMSLNSQTNNSDLQFTFVHSNLIHVSIDFYHTPDSPEITGVHRALFYTTDDRDRLIEFSREDFSVAFNNKVLGWFKDATGVNEPIDDDEWFIKELGL